LPVFYTKTRQPEKQGESGGVHGTMRRTMDARPISCKPRRKDRSWSVRGGGPAGHSGGEAVERRPEISVSEHFLEMLPARTLRGLPEL